MAFKLWSVSALLASTSVTGIDLVGLDELGQIHQPCLASILPSAVAELTFSSIR